MSTAVANHQGTAAPPLAMPGSPLDQNAATVNIPVSKIVRSPWNRHAVIDDEFVESIRKNGVLQNVILRKIKATVAHVTENAGKAPQPFAIGDDIYQLVAGERRWLGAKKAGQATVPSVIRTLTDAEAMELQIRENEERESLNPMERCRAYARLVRQYQEDRRGAGDLKYSRKDAVKDVAERFSKEQRTIYQVLQLEELMPDAKSALESGEITYSHGAEICRRSEEEQAKLMSWLRTERNHSHGDLPSVRRLQREIELLDRENDEKRRQEKLFQEPGDAAAKQTGKVADSVYEEALQIVREVGQKCGSVSNVLLQRRMGMTSRPAELLLERMEREKIVGPADRRGLRPYIRPEQKIAGSDADKGSGITSAAAPAKPATAIAPAHTSAPASRAVTDERFDKALARLKKKPTPAQLKKQEEQQAKEQARYEKERRANQRAGQIHKKFQVALFTAMAKKVQLSHRTLTRLIPNLLFEAWEGADLLPEMFAPQLLGWPEPSPTNGEQAGSYSYNEVSDYAKKHTKKFTPGLLAALLLYLNTAPAETERLARYYAIDPKKLRKKAAAEVKEEERRAREPKKPETREEKQLYRALHVIEGAEKRWAGLRRKGATDAELRKVLKDEMGDGGYAGPDIGEFEYKGAIPAIWFNTMSKKGKPSLQGAALVAAVRDLLKIPQKGAA